MMKYYTGNHTGDNPGNLPAPYYWYVNHVHIHAQKQNTEY